MAGKRVAGLKHEVKSRGAYSVTLNTGKLASGAYVCKFQAGAARSSSQFIITKE